MQARRAVVVLLRSNDKFLITRRSERSEWAPGMWQLPGGLVEEGETFLDAAARESKEEIGIDIASTDLKFIGLIDYMNGSVGDTDIVSFVCSSWKGNIENMEPEKCSDLMWIKPNELPQNSIEHVSAIIKSCDSPGYIQVNNDKLKIRSAR